MTAQKNNISHKENKNDIPEYYVIQEKTLRDGWVVNGKSCYTDEMMYHESYEDAWKCMKEFLQELRENRLEYGDDDFRVVKFIYGETNVNEEIKIPDRLKITTDT